MRTHSAVAAGTQLTGPPAPWCPAGSLMEQYTLQPDGSMTVRAITTVGSNSAEVVQVGSHPSPCTHVALPCPSPLWDPTAQRWCRWAATHPPARPPPSSAHILPSHLVCTPPHPPRAPPPLHAARWAPQLRAAQLVCDARHGCMREAASSRCADPFAWVLLQTYTRSNMSRDAFLSASKQKNGSFNEALSRGSK